MRGGWDLDALGKLFRRRRRRRPRHWLVYNMAGSYYGWFIIWAIRGGGGVGWGGVGWGVGQKKWARPRAHGFKWAHIMNQPYYEPAIL